MSASFVITRVVDDAEFAELIEPSVLNFMRQMHRRAQRIVPKRTWRLHDSLTSEVVREGGMVVGLLGVGGFVNAYEVDYWDHVEYGTSRQKAQPYLRPAFAQSKDGDLTATAMPAPRRNLGGA